MSIDWDVAQPGGEWWAKTIEDGFGNVWRLCTHPDCDLCVMRPGNVQCSGFCEGIDSQGTKEFDSQSDGGSEHGS
jgi:hypothetical protein